MARRSLKPQLNQIRAWVRQGRTDAWIAHQLEVSAAELREFREQHDLIPEEEGAGPQEVDLRDEIEAEVEAATAEAEAEEAAAAEEQASREREEEKEAEAPEREEEKETEAPEADEEKAEAEVETGEARGEGGERARRRRRRGRRGGRGRRKELEATFDHGERDGYGLWLDPAVGDDRVYAEHWAGKREVTVRIEPDQIVIRRAGSPEPDDSDE